MSNFSNLSLPREEGYLRLKVISTLKVYKFVLEIVSFKTLLKCINLRYWLGCKTTSVQTFSSITFIHKIVYFIIIYPLRLGVVKTSLIKYKQEWQHL